MIYTNQMTGKYSHVLAIFNFVTYYHIFLFYLPIPIKAPLLALIITRFLGGFPNGTIKKKTGKCLFVYCNK